MKEHANPVHDSVTQTCMCQHRSLRPITGSKHLTYLSSLGVSLPLAATLIFLKQHIFPVIFLIKNFNIFLKNNPSPYSQVSILMVLIKLFTVLQAFSTVGLVWSSL